MTRWKTLTERQREFTHQLPVNQAPSLSMFVYRPGICDAHPLLRDERTTLVGFPLLVEPAVSWSGTATTTDEENSLFPYQLSS
jgi:hypothetical protein